MCVDVVAPCACGSGGEQREVVAKTLIPKSPISDADFISARHSRRASFLSPHRRYCVAGPSLPRRQFTIRHRGASSSRKSTGLPAAQTASHHLRSPESFWHKSGLRSRSSSAYTGYWKTVDMVDRAVALGPPPDGDCISIENLQLARPVKAPNIWNEVKEQPAWLTVHIYLGTYFSSAASADALDESTIHYGNLAKLLRSECSAESAGGATLQVASAAIEQMAKKPKIDRCIADRIVVKLLLPKASAYGSALEIHESTPCTPKGRDHSSITRTFACKGLKIMTLIGVNAYERKAKQPLIVDFIMDYHHGGNSTLADMEALFPLERALVEVRRTPPFARTHDKQIDAAPVDNRSHGV